MVKRIINTEDLARFKTELLGEIKELLLQQKKVSTKKYIRSPEVLKLLKISPGKLNHLRKNGTLTYSKIGRLIFYDADDIEKVMEDNKVQHK